LFIPTLAHLKRYEIVRNEVPNPDSKRLQNNGITVCYFALHDLPPGENRRVAAVLPICRMLLGVAGTAYLLAPGAVLEAANPTEFPNLNAGEFPIGLSKSPYLIWGGLPILKPFKRDRLNPETVAGDEGRNKYSPHAVS